MYLVLAFLLFYRGTVVIVIFVALGKRKYYFEIWNQERCFDVNI